MLVSRASHISGALTALALTLVGSAAGAQTTTTPPPGREAEVTFADRLPYVERPVTAGLRHLDVHLGFSGEYVDYYRSYTAVGHPLGSFGSHLDVVYGVTDFLEFGAGVGLRVPARAQDLSFVNPDRFARVNREWLPSGLALSRVPYSTGHEYLTNPYLRGRVALLNHKPVYVALDLALSFPIAANSCATVNFGVPVHVIVSRWVRFETGIYNEFVGCEVSPVPGPATRFWTLSVPLRVLFRVHDRAWLGLVTGFETVGYSGDPRNFAVPLGLSAGVRLVPRVDLLFNVVAPEFVHTDPVTNRNVWLDRIGAGVALQLYLL